MKFTRAATVLSSKKRKIEANLVLNSAQLKINDDKLSITDTSNTKSESGIWFQNKSANESDSDIEKEEDKREKEDENNKSNVEIEEPSTERVVSPEIEIKLDKEGEDKLYGAYRNGSISILRKVQKATLELKKQTLKMYNIRELW